MTLALEAADAGGDFTMNTTLRGVRAVVAACLGLALLSGSGCGPGAPSNTAHLSGAVTIAGQPVPSDASATLQIRATGPGQAKSASAEIVDGRYDIAQAPKGAVRVLVSIYKPTGKMIREGQGNPYPELKNMIADEYGKGIDLQVEGDNPKQDFDLKPAE